MQSVVPEQGALVQAQSCSSHRHGRGARSNADATDGRQRRRSDHMDRHGDRRCVFLLRASGLSKQPKWRSHWRTRLRPDLTPQCIYHGSLPRRANDQPHKPANVEAARAGRSSAASRRHFEAYETAIHLNQALCTPDGVGRSEAEEKWVVTPFLR